MLARARARVCVCECIILQRSAGNAKCGGRSKIARKRSVSLSLNTLGEANQSWYLICHNLARHLLYRKRQIKPAR